MNKEPKYKIGEKVNTINRQDVIVECIRYDFERNRFEYAVNGMIGNRDNIYSCWFEECEIFRTKEDIKKAVINKLKKDVKYFIKNNSGLDLDHFGLTYELIVKEKDNED